MARIVATHHVGKKRIATSGHGTGGMTLIKKPSRRPRSGVMAPQVHVPKGQLTKMLGAHPAHSDKIHAPTGAKLTPTPGKKHAPTKPHIVPKGSSSKVSHKPSKSIMKVQHKPPKPISGVK